MNIYILNGESQRVRIEFTPDELLVDKFHQITNGIINKYNGVWEDNSVILTPKKAQQKDNIGIMVDDVRESLICDVLAEDDPKKNKTKSLSLKFTPHPTQTPAPEPVEELWQQQLEAWGFTGQPIVRNGWDGEVDTDD